MAQNKFIKPANRRDFLGKVTGAAALMGVASLINPAKANDSIHSISGYAEDPDDWFKGVKGKHRIVFDAIEPDGFFQFLWPKAYMLTNVASGASEKDCTAVLVLRHSAAVFALQDSIWAKYNLGNVSAGGKQMISVIDPQTNAPAVRNPFWKTKPDDFSLPSMGSLPLGIPELQASGVMICVCGVALSVFSAMMAMGTKQEAATVKKEWIDAVIPGIPVMPSGVWAVGRAQEHGCGYCYGACVS
jgi:intracellular sulfur oxidation DsrE/DsrF family protein